MNTNGESKLIAVFAVALTIIAGTNLTVAIMNRGKIEQVLTQQGAFQSRTVHRWEYLRDANPGLKVPNVIEPLQQPHLSTEELSQTPRPLTTVPD